MGAQHWIEPPYAALGAAVGLLVGLTGVGGGSLMTPMLILLFGVHPMAAVGTDLLFAAATKSVGTLVNGLNHAVDWRMTGLLAAGSLPATAVTLAILSNLGRGDALADGLIRVVLVAALLLTAASLLAYRQIALLTRARTEDRPHRQAATLTIASGVVLGVLVTLTSIGAGALGIVALLYLYPKTPIARLIGSDVAHAVPLTLLAGFGHWLAGSVNLHLLCSLLAGSIPAIVVGSYATARVPERAIRTILAATLIAVAGRMIL
jgi:uncharacterized membrane protein YfcA